jgi:hypothetical protein
MMRNLPSACLSHVLRQHPDKRSSEKISARGMLIWKIDALPDKHRGIKVI